ncbi:ABC transporter substrate-binding protein [Caballeronia sp. LjRoot34]|uniref:ABC transporter substrate-binding protein n=1 Tax=Caballeronia sp. LjRoot34 TaxID=3342325 RepID=UPI003ECCC7DD
MRISILLRAMRALFVAGAVGLTSSHVAIAADATTIRLGLFKGSALAAQIAQNQGAFEKQGIHLQLVYLNAGPAILLATARGMVDIGYGDTYAWVSAIENGFTNVKLIAPANGTTSWLIASPGGPVKSGDDIAGKRVGVTPTPYTIALVRHWVRLHHGDPDSVKFVTVPIGGQLAAMKTGDLDAVFSFDFLTKRELEHAGGKTVADFQKETPADATAANYYTNDAFIAQHPDVVVKFVRILREATATFNRADDASKAVLQGPIAGVDYTDLSKTIPGLLDKPEWTTYFQGPFEEQATQQYVDIGVQEHVIARPLTIKPYVYWTATASDASLIEH